MHLSFLHTLILAFPVLYLGKLMVARIEFLRTYNIPAAVVGGLTAAIVITILLHSGMPKIVFNTDVRDTLMLAFFSTIGLGASYKLLLYGGKPVFIFLIAAIGLLVVQNLVGTSLAVMLGEHPALGLIGGTITLSGGHGTGLAWSQVFETHYPIAMQGALEISLAAATFGLIAGGLLGGPVAEKLMRTYKPKRPTQTNDPNSTPAFFSSETQSPQLGINGFVLHIFIILFCMLVATTVSTHFALATVPSFVWAILCGIIIRNVSEVACFPLIEAPILDIIARIALSLFLAAAIMSVEIIELAHLALPMMIILFAQVAAMATYAYYITYRIMGSNYNAAVIAGGHCGFGLGATPTAIANMGALSERYGPSPQAFLAVPLVGAFFIDIANVGVIKLFLWLMDF
ncbi:MAG: sodium/glutamate symporter [Alphaproteobacteria bacterium GM202ARS2]|nr:sodium/glutamate symporter [Alphaproteobacteria bacterium GM202ARS2]